MYQYGDGVAKDHRTAAQWYEPTANQGDEKAQYNLGFLYYNSQYLNCDDEAAVKWFRLAAKQGLLVPKQTLALPRMKAGVLSRMTYWPICG